MKTEKIKVHFSHRDVLHPTNPIPVNLIGAGGTGSQMLTALARMNHSLNALGHAGLLVTLWDDDTVSPANLGRQLFAECEVGLYKSVALINRCNRFFGTDWKATHCKFGYKPSSLPTQSTIYISCVDTAAARFEIAETLKGLQTERHYRNVPRYWMDFGNSRTTGQVILATLGKVQQPVSEEFVTIDTLPFITDEFGELLRHSESEDNTPSCSLAEALDKQDLFINSTLAQMGSSLLWNLFRHGMTAYRGFFLNLENFRTTPIGV
ncbi:PRTRC system ThiF family protein [Flavobacterium sp. Sd200]|uniref:PRTRC system ThiF family protein n=1 Tax=Flavobacterium sp. Sd200 TaxID=2692211 RepID=UPI00136BFF45|nr:PRTRC system ThiF family protein [Flavobacterium sp. Sd200]MXN91673.1 PRTRC system ThiF family protein [Flavobacterium sp. Sd200]